MRPILHKLRRWAVIIIALAIIGPFVVVIPLNLVQPPTTAIMLWRTGQRLAQGKRPVYPRRDIVGHDDISRHLHRAVLAAEDDRFYLHDGFDFEEIENAIERARRGRRMRGASTISQQVAKNLFLWEGRSWIRKGYEAYLTMVLELCLSKERILDLYLNLAEWGDGVFGAEMAARTHFRKPAKSLTREEAARLAAILPAPRRWSPRGSIATRRAGTILARMQYAAPLEEPPPRPRR
ncbi:MAG TPA: monofunctional biosynthetic peptidoglycan transglycosylase [bacterium]|nr:monofunctional biosynthetic peptidoglycan transglycosylase [bacterium]